MDDKRLITYLNDHLTGSITAIDMAETTLEENRQTPLGHFLAKLLEELRQDQEVLKSLIEVLGGKEDRGKKLAGWMAEKMNRVRMAGGGMTRLRRLEALEMLLVGIRGKLALWVSLEEIGRVDQRLHGPDFRDLQEKAKRQMEEVEAERLRAVRQAFLEEG